jgi:hypothetical protein
VLFNALVASVDNQNLFTDNHGFEIIMHLLLSADETHAKFELYERFFKLYGVLSDPATKKSLLCRILLNFEVWLRCTPQDHAPITTHWAQALFPQNTALFFQEFQVSFFLSAISSFYWSTFQEDQICHMKERTRGQPLNVQKCRQNILKIIMTIGKNQFTDTDFSLILSQIMTAHESKEALFFLGILLAVLNERTFSNIEQICVLQHRFTGTDNKLIKATLSVFISAHRRSLTFSLAELIGQQPVLFSLVSWIAAFFGQKSIARL